MTTDAPPASGTEAPTPASGQTGGGAETGTGLRERKKQATREALSWAALRLAVDRGLENVRVEDIAAEAGVSPRTFNNYFSSKYEAILSRHVDRVRVAAEAGEELFAAFDRLQKMKAGNRAAGAVGILPFEGNDNRRALCAVDHA